MSERIKLSGKIEFVLTPPHSFTVMGNCARRNDVMVKSSGCHDGLCYIVRELIGRDEDDKPITAKEMAIVHSATKDPTQWKQHWMSVSDYYDELGKQGFNHGSE